DLRTQSCRARTLREEVVSTPLAALHRINDCCGNDAPEQHAPDHSRVDADLESIDRTARKLRRLTELLLDAQQLVVLRYAIGARRAACLDLTRTGRDGQIRNERVLGLAAAV